MTPKSLLHPARLARRPVLATQTDGRLVDLVRAGYEPAFEAIVDRYRGPLLRYIGRILPAERAEDALQQVFVSAYQAILRDRAEIELRPWLYRIAHNTALNGLRDRGLRHEPLPEAVDGVERPDQALERRQGLASVLTAVRALPERQRDAILLRELEGRSYQEIAGTLGVTDGAVRQLLNRARTTLRATATALVPQGVVTRLTWGEPAEPLAARVAEMCGAGAAGGVGALAAKLCTTALVTGAVVGGVAVSPGGEGGAARPALPDAARAAPPEPEPATRRSDVAGPSARAAAGGGPSGHGGRGPSGPDSAGERRDDPPEDREGPERDPGDDDRSGSGHGGDDGADELEAGEDRSGPSEPETAGLGDDSSGSGSGTSGSGTSGSGESGSGSDSGSGSGDSSGTGSGGELEAGGELDEAAELG